MSQKEFQRVKVIENAVGGRLSVSEAARLLQLSERQVQRLKRRYRPEAVDWVHHRNRGRPMPWALPTALRRTILQLARGKYQGFNDSHLCEKRRSQAQAEKRVVARTAFDAALGRELQEVMQEAKQMVSRMKELLCSRSRAFKLFSAVLDCCQRSVLLYRLNPVLHCRDRRIHFALADNLAIPCRQSEECLSILRRFALVAGIVVGVILHRVDTNNSALLLLVKFAS